MSPSCVFEPERSFIASALHFDVYSTFERVRVSTDVNPLYQGWLFTGRGPGVPGLDFWFGCYRTGEVRQYLIRSCLREPQGQWAAYHGLRLDISRNDYLGFYAATDVEPAWRLIKEKGNYEVARTGQHQRLKIVTGHNRSWQFGKTWCSVSGGADLYLSMQVDQLGVAEF